MTGQDDGRASRNAGTAPAAANSSANPAGQLYLQAVREHEAGRISQAEGLYAQTLALAPRHVGALVNLGVVRRTQGKLDEAIDLYERALEISPTYAKGLNNLGDAHWLQDNLARAEACFRRAVELDPAYVDAHYNLGGVLTSLGRLDEAATAFERVIELQPDHVGARTGLGVSYQQLGRLRDAADAFLHTIACEPNTVRAYYHLAELVSVKDGPVSANALSDMLTERRQDGIQCEPEERPALLFAIGKTFEKLGRFDEAFEALAEANAIVRKSQPFDIGSEGRRMAAVAEVFDTALMARFENQGPAGPRPIFIVGMARSGTTLVEQIVSSHPQVLGGGELPMLRNLVEGSSGKDGSRFPVWAARMNRADCQVFGQAYLDSLPALPDGKTRLTDKSLAHHEHIGLIHACLPNAPIIYCRRDPRDIALSCFATWFADGQHGYSYDLADLGRYWRAFDKLMNHWRAVLPPGRMLEVTYEEVVGDVEGWTRRLIAHCGLEWDDACLKFYESERTVRTASFAQVRQPIYTGSLARWRRYERHLEPLLEALGPPYNSEHPANG